MPAEQIATNLALINWTLLTGLAVGSFAVVVLARLATPATKGYLAFTAFCAACHGLDGNPPEGLPYPRIAGQSERYISQQLALFKSGERNTGLAAAMIPFATPLSPQDMRDLGAFFATKSPGAGIADDGLVTASFSNGETAALGKVAVATFVNMPGLRQEGNSYWEATGKSGAAKFGTANQGAFGAIRSSTIEGSNVDITEELVQLIAAQRNFQANAKALDTSSQISQTIFNIRS